jgi:hypothetical protein
MRGGGGSHIELNNVCDTNEGMHISITEPENRLPLLLLLLLLLSEDPSFKAWPFSSSSEVSTTVIPSKSIDLDPCPLKYLEEVLESKALPLWSKFEKLPVSLNALSTMVPLSCFGRGLKGSFWVKSPSSLPLSASLKCFISESSNSSSMSMSTSRRELEVLPGLLSMECEPCAELLGDIKLAPGDRVFTIL